MASYKVNTIYPAFMGEVNMHGIGCPCTFVRLAGCNLRCYHTTKGTFCDTPEALCKSNGKDMSTEEILSTVMLFNNKVICLTGGEPLLQNVKPLLDTLSRWGFSVVVETNGSKWVKPYKMIPRVSFVVDVKSPSSGESKKMIESNYHNLGKNDFLKFIIDDEEDYAHFKNFVDTYGGALQCRIAVGTFWGSAIGYQNLIDLLAHDRLNVYINMQTHKMACMYDHFKSNSEFGTIFIPQEL